MTNFGQLQSINAREYWAHEALDFTPWLASDGNIDLLGDALGVELEVENTEVAVGPYSADIVARDTGSGRYVVIENLLGKTDHRSAQSGKGVSFRRAHANTRTPVGFLDRIRKAPERNRQASLYAIASSSILVQCGVWKNRYSSFLLSEHLGKANRCSGLYLWKNR